MEGSITLTLNIPIADLGTQKVKALLKNIEEFNPSTSSDLPLPKKRSQIHQSSSLEDTHVDCPQTLSTEIRSMMDTISRSRTMPSRNCPSAKNLEPTGLSKKKEENSTPLTPDFTSVLSGFYGKLVIGGPCSFKILPKITKALESLEISTSSQEFNIYWLTEYHVPKDFIDVMTLDIRKLLQDVPLDDVLYFNHYIETLRSLFIQSTPENRDRCIKLLLAHFGCSGDNKFEIRTFVQGIILAFAQLDKRVDNESSDKKTLVSALAVTVFVMVEEILKVL